MTYNNSINIASCTDDNTPLIGELEVGSKQLFHCFSDNQMNANPDKQWSSS